VRSTTRSTAAARTAGVPWAAGAGLAARLRWIARAHYGDGGAMRFGRTMLGHVPAMNDKE
jgi:hypothetical protein